MQKLLYTFIALVLFNNVQAQTPPSLTITQFAQGFSIPIGIEHCGDSRLFIVQQRGIIKILNATAISEVKSVHSWQHWNPVQFVRHVVESVMNFKR